MKIKESISDSGFRMSIPKGHPVSKALRAIQIRHEYLTLML